MRRVAVGIAALVFIVLAGCTNPSSISTPEPTKAEVAAAVDYLKQHQNDPLPPDAKQRIYVRVIVLQTTEDVNTHGEHTMKIEVVNIEGKRYTIDLGIVIDEFKQKAGVGAYIGHQQMAKDRWILITKDTGLTIKGSAPPSTPPTSPSAKPRPTI